MTFLVHLSSDQNSHVEFSTCGIMTVLENSQDLEQFRSQVFLSFRWLRDSQLAVVALVERLLLAHLCISCPIILAVSLCCDFPLLAKQNEPRRESKHTGGVAEGEWR